MRKGNKFTFLVTIMCTFALLMNLFSITPIATTATYGTSNRVTATTNASVKQGNVGYCYVYIDSLESLSSLNVAVHYDPDKISVTSSFNQASSDVYEIYDSSIKESYVQYSYIFKGNGKATKTQLFYFEYKVLNNAEIGTAYFDIVVSEAYDSSLNVANVSGSRCAFTIQERIINKTCSISGVSSVSSAIEEEFELSYRLNTSAVASGSFVIRYDAEVFEFLELTAGGLLDNKIVDIKTDFPGAIYVSFVGTEYANSSQLLNVKFKTVKNADETSQIKLSVTDFYDLDLNSIACSGYTTTAKVVFDPTYSENAPSMTVSTEYSAVDNKVTLTIVLEEGSHLGAGDFVLNFNTKYFAYNSYAEGFNPTFFNINDKKVSEGVFKFSIISLSDVLSEETVLTVVFDTPVFCEDITAEFDLSGSGLSDSLTNTILLNFVDGSLSISGVGHDIIAHEAKAPTCTEIGWNAYETCSRCDYTTYEEIPATGHSYVHTSCTVCGSKQPLYRAWNVSATGDNSLVASLYENHVDGGFELEFTGSGNMIDWDSTSSVPWYVYRYQINNVIIEDGITSIGSRALYECTALTSVTIPNNVETIGDYAFYGCSNLSSIIFGNSVRSIGNRAFCNCYSLKSVTIPESVAMIGGYAFYNCKALTEINFNAVAMEDLVSGNCVFYNAGIESDGISVRVGANATKIPAYIFYPTSNSSSYCPNITSVMFASGSVCESIGNHAFYYADELTSVNLPASIKTIGNYAFYNCKALTDIAFDAVAMENLVSGNYVFYNAGIESDGIAVRIGADVTKIPAYLFYPYSSSDCPNITSVEFANDSVCESIGAYAFYYADGISSIELPETVKNIGTYAFAHCYALASVDLGSSVETIGAYAFYNCTALTSLAIPEAVTSIGNYVFYNCTALTSVTIPEAVTSIGLYAFYNCYSLKSVTIPESVAMIGDSAFSNCKALTEINFNAVAMEDLAINNYVFYNAGIESDGIAVRIGADVTKIPAYLFYPYSSSDCPNITSVEFANDSVCESIGACAFYYADGISSIELPETVKNIGNYAFAHCYALASLDLGNSVETIGMYAFYNCTALTSVTIPEDVTSIGIYAFYNCNSLTQIVFNAASMSDFANNNNVFYNAGKNGSGIVVTIGNEVTRVPAYLFYATSNSTSYLPKITLVEFEDGSACESIGSYAFYYSSNLLRLIIPDTISEIGTYAFYGCSKAVIAFEEEALPITGSNWYSSEATYYLNAKQFVVINEALYVILNDNTATFAKYYGEATEYQVLDAVEGITVTAIGTNAFRNNTKVEYVTIPESITQINAYAFYGCSALKSITIPKNITAIGKSAFYNCTNVEEIAFNAISMDDLAYENYVFYNNGKNTEGISVTIGAEVTKIPAYLFRSAHDDSYNPKITSIVFAENSVCESIGGCSFYGLDYLTTIIIPESVTSIASHAMSYCLKLTIGFEAAEAPETLGSYWNADSGYYLNVKEFIIYDDATYVITNDGKAILGRYFGTATQFEILEEVNGITVTVIGAYAFYQNKTLNSVEIPSNVTSVGNNAFYYCTAMTDVVLPNGILTIGNNAFYGCSALATILIPETVTNIGSSAFNSCSKLTIGFASATQNATLGSSWSGDSGYYLNVKEFVVYDDATYVVTNDNTAALGRYYGTATEYAILERVNGASVTIVGKGAFRNISSLVIVSIPDTVTRIENNAFYYCTALESITIPENVVHIGNYAFYYTRALTEINFNAIAVNDLSSSNYVFCYSGQGGDGIKVTIGAQVTKIPNYLFYPRSSATYLPKITEFVFEEGSVCKIIGAYTFAYNTNLSSIILPEGVEVIGSYAFANTNIATIVIPDSVTTINSYAFNNCANLAIVHMPSALTSIGAYAFYNCSLLSEIVIPEGVTTIDSCAFQNVGFKLVYICSDKIAYNANSSSACGYLLDGVSSVVIRSDIELISNYIAENYTNIEAIAYQGSDYVIYSVHEHSWSEHQVLVPYIACEQDGCIRYVCSDCGAYKDVTTFKHDVIINAAKEPDCTNVGWHEYHTCSKCDYTTYIEIPALGHRVLIDGRIWVDSITFENDTNYPFTLQDGIYSSTNHLDNTDSYFTITALYDCTLNISYAISSEQNYDKIIVRVNGSTVVEISGQVDWASKSIELNAGDIVTINYHKDGSVAKNEDTGWFSFACEKTAIGAFVPSPAEDAEPTCTEAVVCHYCQTVVKEALGHDEIHHSAQAQTCTDIGWHAYDTCSRCDYTTYVEIPANGHSYGDWTVILDPTCTEIGTERRDCNVCDHYETRDVVALGHNEINHSAQAPTCTEIGWHVYVTCSRCDYTTYVEIPALGHDLINHEAREETCLEIGWDAYDTCSRCDYTTYVEIPALGHDLINHEAREENCVEVGWCAYDTCSRCDYTTFEEIPATGHHLGEWAEALAPTCTEVGTDRRDCNDCDYYETRDIAALGHTFVDRRCEVCGEAQPALETWDISADGSGNLMASIYQNYVDGGYDLIITGSGDMKDYSTYGTTVIPWYSKYSSKISYIELPEGLTSIGKYAFSYCTALRQINIPDSVTKFSSYAFGYSDKLVIVIEGEDMPTVLNSGWDNGCSYYLSPQKVILEENATYVIDKDGNACLAKYIGSESEFVALKAVDGIPVTRIGQYAFYQKTNMKTYWIPEDINYIDRYAFYSCNGLAILFENNILPAYLGSSWNNGSPYYVGATLWEDGDFRFVRDASGTVALISYLGNAQEIIIPATSNGYSVHKIGDYAFYESSIRSVVISEGIQTIGAYAFRYCRSLETIQLPDSLSSIGNYAFQYCSLLRSIVIPEGVASLYATFNNCTALESVSLPEGITRIDSMTFYYCTSLKELCLPDTVTYIGSSAFKGCTSLKIFEIPALVHSISWSSAFGSTALDTLYIHSDKLAATLNSSVLASDPFKALKTVVVPAGTATEYVKNKYPYCETINRDGTDYDVYSLNAHTWSENVIVEYVECQTDGVIEYTCADCGVVKKVITPCHNIIDVAAKDPTCTEIGWDAHEACTRCDYSTCVEIPALGHRVIIPRQAWVDPISFENDANYPFAFSDGVYASTNKAHSSDSYFTITALYDCTLNIFYSVSSETNCDKLIIRLNGNIVATISGLIDWTSQTLTLTAGDVVTINYHKDGSVDSNEDTGWFKFEFDQVLIDTSIIMPAEDMEPTCTEGVVCDFCHEIAVPALGHDEINHDAQAPTCTEVGWNAYVTCSRCDYSTYDEIPAIGHSYSTAVTAPTCTEAGYTTYTCHCGDSYVADHVDALGHTEVIDAAVAPTCTATGLTEGKHCSVCSEILVSQEVIPANGHSYDAVVTAPTCTEAGYTTYTCHCGDSYVADYVDALGHTEAVDTAVAPDCTNTGLTEGKHCSVCNEVLVAQNVVDALGHNEVIDEGKEPTELKPGISDGKHCDRCGEVLVAQETIPALGVNINFKINSARLNLDSDINIAYIATVPAGYTDFYMIFTFNGQDYRVEAVDNGDGRYRFLFDKVIPQMVGDNIVATLYATNAYGEVVTNCISEYSVRKYCVNQLGKSNDEKLKTMLSDLLVYAEKAQLYSGYKTDMLVTAGLEDIMTPSTFTSIDASTNKQQISGTADDSVKWRSAGLVYQNAMALYIKFTATDLDGLEVRITRNGRTYTYTPDMFDLGADGRYTILHQGIYFTQFDDAVTATFHRNGEQIGETLTYSVNSYIYRNQDNSNAKLCELLRATYVYGESAKAYKNK